MTREEARAFKVPLFFSLSNSSTEKNKTGNWSFIQPSYGDRAAPCSAACPCGTDIPRVESLVSAGRFQEALAAILMENPLPGVTGRVCFHPCERACNRGDFDEAVSVSAIERFLSDERLPSVPAWKARPSTGKAIAILGAGPAGLSAATFLARLGHGCEVFEAEAEAGGLLRWGIPAYRLPPEVLAREVASIAALGVKFHLGRAVDPSFLVREAGRFDAIIVSGGMGSPIGLGLPGESLAMDGLAFLKAARSDGAAPPGPVPTGGRRKGERVAVIGGGNSAIDLARTLVRQGCKPLIVYRRRREDMPAFAHEVERAIEEGVEILELASPLGLSREGGEILLDLACMESAGPGPDGRIGSRPIPGKGKTLRVSEVYTAIGASGECGKWLALADGAAFHDLGRARMAFGPRPVAICGDLVTEEKSVAEAMASGKEAALAIDSFFTGGMAGAMDRLAAARLGDGLSLSMEAYCMGLGARPRAGVVKYAELNTAYFKARPRTQAPALSPAQSIASFDEVEAGLDANDAQAEAGRCFSCGSCNDCDNCRSFCPDVAAVRDGGGRRRIDVEHCKGCGVCVEECPRGAICMEEGQT